MTAPATRVQAGPRPAAADRRPRRSCVRCWAPRAASAILLDGSRDPNSGVTVLVTAPGADGPRPGREGRHHTGRSQP